MVYDNYILTSTFGIISNNSIATLNYFGIKVATGAVENICIWCLKSGEAIRTLSGSRILNRISTKVTKLTYNLNKSYQLVAGYEDGNIRLWDVDSANCNVSFNGHKSDLTALRFDSRGILLSSGSKDNNIIIWDLVAESGLCFLKGHKEYITDLVFLTKSKRLVSSSKDSTLKIWNFENACCCQTVNSCSGEVWTVDSNPEETILVSGSNDSKLCIYRYIPDNTIFSEESDTSHCTTKVLHIANKIKLLGEDRVSLVRFDYRGKFLGVQSHDSILEFYYMRTITKKHKSKKTTDCRNYSVRSQRKTNSLSVKFSEDLEFMQAMHFRKKIGQFSFQPETFATKTNTAVISLSFTDNCFEIHCISKSSTECLGCVDFPGHRDDITAVALSPDDKLLLTISKSACKVWNPHTGICMRTIKTINGVDAIFVLKGDYVVIGTTMGTLKIIDIKSGLLLQTLEAHTGIIWSISPLIDGSGMISGGADSYIKFWTFQFKDVDGKQSISLIYNQSLCLSDSVLHICCTPNGKMILASLLDSTIKAYHIDSLKLIFSVSELTMPALCIDISSDGMLMVSGCVDKKLRIHEPNFGEIKKNILAHQDSLTKVSFVHNTHFLFSAGKDFMIRYWDCDKYQQILLLNAHHGEVWALSVSHSGNFVVSAGRDRTIRYWKRTKIEPPKHDLTKMGKMKKLSKDNELENALDLLEDSVLASSCTSRVSFGDHIWFAIARIPITHLTRAISRLPFSSILRLLYYLPGWLSSSERFKKTVKISDFLLTEFQLQFSTMENIKSLLATLRKKLLVAMETNSELIGSKLTSLIHYQKDHVKT
jgi:U3 small nucleolar RNA-associated protein 12